MKYQAEKFIKRKLIQYGVFKKKKENIMVPRMLKERKEQQAYRMRKC